MQDALRVFAGDCTVTYEDDDGSQSQRGRVVTLVKPDGTVLVHDAGGYRPAAWLTRADAVSVVLDGDDFRITAGDGAKRLRVESHETLGRVRFPVSAAGPPVGACPHCEGAMVRDGDAVACTDCRRRYSVPRDAVVADGACSDCGLPTVLVERGVAVTVCVDRDCDPLADAVAAALDWECPDCGVPLDVTEDRGLHVACPECSRRHRLPTGAGTGTCDCGLPTVDEECLDAECADAP